MVETEEPEIKGVSDADLGEAMARLPCIPLTEAEDADRFMRQIRSLTEQRAQAGWPGENSGKIAVFVMVDRPRQWASRIIAIVGAVQNVLDLQANTEPLFGRLFILNKDGSNGFFIPIPCSESDILDWLMKNGFSDSPVAILWGDTQKLALRRSGPSDDVRYEDVRQQQPQLTLEELLKAIGRFYERELITPGDCRGVWEAGLARQYVPGPQPERSIQYALRLALDSWFHGVVKAEAEDTTRVGRIDVSLLTSEASSQRLGYWAIIELKVVRSVHNAKKGQKPTKVLDKENVEAVIDGLKQVHFYKTERGAELGLLEVYDLRKSKKPDLCKNANVKATISDCSSEIEINVRPLFGSDKDYRDSQFS